MVRYTLALLLSMSTMCACGSREDVAAVPFEGPTGEAAFPLPDCVSESPCAVAFRDENGLCALEWVPGCSECVTPAGTPGSARDGGACCGGCWAGSWCSEDPNANACGAEGRLCDPCHGSEMCIQGVCGYPS